LTTPHVFQNTCPLEMIPYILSLNIFYHAELVIHARIFVLLSFVGDAKIGVPNKFIHDNCGIDREKGHINNSLGDSYH
jgi:hypothetical protein